MMRVGLYRPVHVKTLTSQKQRMLLTARQLLKAKAIDIEGDLRGTLRNFGLKVGVVGAAKFEARPDQSTSVAFMVILALSSLETGQPALALPASSSSFAWSAPGTLPFKVRWTAVMAKPSATFSSVTSAVVSMCSAVSLASPRMSDRAIVKHPACAAPMSSSGLVPGLPSNRLLKPYGYSLSAPLLVEIAPLPSLISPCQTAVPWVFTERSPCCSQF